MARMNPRGNGIQRQFSNRDSHPAGTLVTEAKNPFTIGDNNEPYVTVIGIAENRVNIIGVNYQEDRKMGETKIKTATRLGLAGPKSLPQ